MDVLKEIAAIGNNRRRCVIVPYDTFDEVICKVAGKRELALWTLDHMQRPWCIFVVCPENASPVDK
jgi:hypothetical protein